MANDGIPAKIPVASVVHGSRTPTAAKMQEVSGKALPPSGNALAIEAAKAGLTGAKPPASAPAVPDKPPIPVSNDPQALVAQLNKHLNDSGRPDQYRVDPSSDGKLIQQLNPANGAVVGEFLVSEFPALARSVGVPGLIIDSHA